MHQERTSTLICYPELPEAARLADLSGVYDDLETVLAYCSVLEKQILENVRDIFVWDAVASSAVVLYARCFAKGWREPLQHDLLQDAPPALCRAHSFFIELRNKHIAHSVNAFEENVVVLQIAMIGGKPQRVDDVSIQSRRFMAVEADEVAQLRQLTEWLQKQVETAYDEEKVRVLQRVAEIDLNEVIELTSEPLPAFFEQGSISKRRR